MRQKRLHSILFMLFLSCCLLLTFFIINIIGSGFSFLNLCLIVITLGIVISIGKKLPEDIEEMGNWMDDEQMLNFIEIIEFRNKEMIKNETQIPIDTIQSIYLIKEMGSWALCVNSLKSVNYIESITLKKERIIDKLIERGFFEEEAYNAIIKQPDTFKSKVIDYFDFIYFPEFELYRKT